MLPEALLSKYKQYKHDTASIAAWLHSTAHRCGYDSQAVAKPVTTPAAGKLKGRARKLARDAASAAKKPQSDAGKNASSNGETKYEVKIREFVPMAESIADYAAVNAGVKISTGTVKIFKRCIQARTGAIEWFRSSAGADSDSDGDTKSTEGHTHIVNVLQQALQALIPVHDLQELEKASFKLSEANLSKKTDPALSLSNAFTHLEIEELDEPVNDATRSAAATPVGSSAAPQKVTYSAEEDSEEWIFALFCFFDDLHDIRGYLNSLWAVYMLGHIDLSTVAVVTNTAIDLVRRAEHEFHKNGLSIPKPYGDKEFKGHLCHCYFMETCLREGLPPLGPTKNMLVPLEAYDQVEESFLLVWRVMLIHTEQIRHTKGSVPVTRPPWIGTYDPLLDRSTASPEEIYEQDSALLLDMLVTLVPFATLSETPNDDELMKGLHDELLEGRLPTWLVFAGQVYLDIHSILRTKGTQPFSDLYDFALDARRVLRGHNKFQDKRALVGNQSLQSQAWIDDVHKNLEDWVFNDKTFKILDKGISLKGQLKGNKKTGSKKTREWKEYEILRMHPLLAGMWKYSFQLMIQCEGIRLVNETQVLVAAHLYNALRQNNYLPTDLVWADAEYLLSIHAKANTFLGSRPVSIEDCTKRLALAQGVSPQTFAPNRRPGQRVVLSKSGGKFLRPSTPVAGVFINRFLEGGSIELSLDNIETILGHRLEERKVRHASKVKMVTAIRELNNQGISIGTFEGFNAMLKAMDRPPLSKSQWQAKNEGEGGELMHEVEKELAPKTQVERDGGVVGEDGSLSAESEDSDEDDSIESGEMDFEAAVLDKWEQTHSLGLVEFLRELGKALNDECLDLQFDYFGFHRQTRTLLEKIHRACLPLASPNTREPMTTMLESEEGPLMLPALIMLLACDPSKARNLLALKADDWDVDDSGLVTAAEVMREFIEREGSTYSVKEEKRLEMRKAMGKREHGDDWEEELELTAANAGIPGAVGRWNGLNVQENADKMKAWTIDDTVRAREQEIKRMLESEDGETATQTVGTSN